VRHIGLLTGGLILITVLAYWQTSVGLWDYWLEPYVGGQGVLVALLASWLVYRARTQLAATPVRPFPWGVVPLIALGIATLVLWRAQIQTLEFALLPPLILLAVLTAFGTDIMQILLVPIGFLYFGIPLWDLLTPLLQTVTVHVVGAVAPHLGLPATIRGFSLVFPNGDTFVVTPPCGGVGLLVQGLAVATLLGELEAATLARRLKLWGSMLGVALLTNWLRVLIIVDAGYTTGMRHVIVTRHLLFGWLFFVLVLIVFVWVAARGAPPERTAHPEGAGATVATPPMFRAYALAVLALALVPVLNYTLRASPARSATALLRLPPGQAPWSGPSEDVGAEWRPQFAGQHDEAHAVYRDDAGRRVEVMAIGYAVQEHGRKLVSEGNTLLGSDLYEISGRPIDGGGQPYYEMVVADAQGRESVIWYVYNIGGRTFVIPAFSQLWYGVRALSEQPYSVLIALRAPCTQSCASAHELLATFVRSLGGPLAGLASPGAAP
jgi:EpsI family protein